MSDLQPILEAQGLYQSYGPKTVLQDVSFRLPPGTVGLLGPNGSGKSTLLRTLLGLIPFTRGTASVLQLDVRDQPLEIRRRVGLVPESECLVPGMNAVELATYAGELVGMRHVDARERAHQVLYYVGLGESRYRDLGGYSQGMKQRLKLAQALVHDPDLLLLDEPTNGMDPPGREAMLQLIRDISGSKGMSVVLSTHLLPDVRETCDWVLVLNEGKVVGSQSTREIVAHERPTFELRGRGALADLAGLLRERGCEVVESKGALRVALQQGEGTPRIFEAIHALGGKVEIRHLLPVGRSLEDIFLEAVR